MAKLERDGKVAVLVSPGYGAGWSTWNSECREVLCFEAEIVEAVLSGDNKAAESIAARLCPNAYLGGASDLCVEWVTKGEAFEIVEYDGSESLNIIGEQSYLVA